MPVQKPVFGPIAKDPKPKSFIVLDPIVVARAVTRVGFTPPFSSQALRSFQAHDAVFLMANKKLYGGSAGNQDGNLNRHRRIDQSDGTYAICRPICAFKAGCRGG